MKSHKFETLNFDAVWTAIGRSKQLRDAIERAANETKKEAEQIAQRVAYDQGYYAKAFDTAVATGKQARKDFDTVARKRRGSKQNANRFIERTNGDPDGGAYNGTIATVYNTDFKALWVEFGSIAKGPRMVMAQAGEKVAAALKGSYEQLYEQAIEQNLTELGRRISAGKKAR